VDEYLVSISDAGLRFSELLDPSNIHASVMTVEQR
jgi:hypothetical protein